jgi:hypothetical protein
MKFNSIRLGVATALAIAASAAAGAVTPTFTAPADGATNLTDLSGATSTDGVMFAALVGTDAASLCDSTGGAPDVYTTETQLTPGTLIANFAVVCKPKSTISGLANTTVQAIRKYSGGSGSGIGNVASGATVAPDATNDRQWVTLNSGGCASSSLVAAAGGLQAYNLFLSCANDVAQITKGGISDEEPALLGATSTQLGQLTTSPGIAVDFAPVISTQLFSDLQTAQHLTANGIDDQVNMPNLSSAQVRGILKGSITTSAFLFANPAGDTGTATGLTAKTIFVCRRGNSSGTQTGFALQYLHAGCGTAGVGTPSLAFASATGTGATNACTPSGCGWASATYGTDQVFAGTGSQDVINCMDFHSGNGDYAIGVLTTEYAPNTTNARYRHVKVDGVAPSLENMQMGAWDFFTEDAFNVPNSTAPNFANVQPDQKLITAALLAAFKAPALLQVALVPQGTSTGGAAWWGGALAIPATLTSSPAPQGTGSVHALVQTTPVNSMTRASSLGGGLNNCNPPWMGSRSLVPVDSPNF